ncbi:MAG TPA: hypothetical protein VFC93_06150 [Chloroflexota bacterium]|nr:hypothetical protein [Chloroflexota bacterium]
MNRRDLLKAGLALVPVALGARVMPIEAADEPDFDLPSGSGVPEGHFFAQTGGSGSTGFPVFNDRQAPMWTIFKGAGGVAQWGYPISDRWVDVLGRVNQAFQKGVFQLTVRPQGQLVKIEWLNVYDELAARQVNLDNLADLTPPSFDWSSDAGRAWGHTADGPGPGTVEANHLDVVFGHADAFPRLWRTYLANPSWFDQYGLPMGVKDYGRVVAVRCQRAALQLWKDQTPWTSAPGEVVFANSGEVARKYGLVPPAAATAKPSPW